MAETTDPADRVCSRTGLALVSSAGRELWRIQKSSYGALNPRVPDSVSKVGEWGRWDVLAHRTIYASDRPVGAYLETLQSFRLDPDDSPKLGDLFDDEADDGTTLLDAVTEEWDISFHFKPGLIPLGWRGERSLYKLRLPHDRWLVDVGHSESVGTIGRTLRAQLQKEGVGDLTISEIAGSRRAVTAVIAAWIHGLVLDDGSLPLGIRYDSKWGNDQACYAIWLRDTDDGDADKEPTKLIQTQCIDWDSTDLLTAMRRHNLVRSF